MKKVMICGITAGISVVIFLLLLYIGTRVAGQVPDQTSNLFWGGKGYAQISCYSSKEDAFTPEELLKFEYDLNKKIKDQKNSKSKEDQKLWTDAYFGKSRISVSKGSVSVEGIAYGVSGDFFQFHPLQLISGAYPDKSNVMKDYILLDEEAAWQLFGSDEVEGLKVKIGEDSYVVSGVYRKPSGRFQTAAGNGEITYYLPYESLQKYDETLKITGYELMVVNPVEHFGYDFVKNYFQPQDPFQNDTVENGSNSSKDTGSSTDSPKSSVSEQNPHRTLEIVENSDRYRIGNLWEHLVSFGTNTMDKDQILYPYWEKVARGYLSVLTLLFVFRIAVILPGVICMVILSVTGIRRIRAVVIR